MELQVDATSDLKYTVDANHSFPVNHDIDSTVVDFDGPNDRSDPLNWIARYKWCMVILISILSLIV
jgi:hypothetical protein